MAAPTFPGLKIEARGSAAWLLYDRPPINAFDWEMLGATRDALEHLVADPAVRVIVVASAIARYFSSGADLKVFHAMAPGQMGAWVRICHDIVRVMRTSPKPLLASIEGTAVGGGLEITLHCDVRFASSDARMGQPEINIAFIPPIGATQALARLVGRPRALRMLYEGTLLTAAQALEAGLVDFVVDPADLKGHVDRYVERLAAKPAAALAAIRRTITLGGGMPFDDGLELELRAAAGLAGNRDFKEGLRAFLEKRAPQWAHEPESGTQT